MRHERTTVNNDKQVILKFIREDGDPTLDDDFINTVMAKEKLRPVTKSEFEDYCSKVLGKKNPKVPLVMFGNIGRGESEAHFAGVMFLDTDGEGGVIENWTRGSTGKQWSGDYEFLLAPID